MLPYKMLVSRRRGIIPKPVDTLLILRLRATAARRSRVRTCGRCGFRKNGAQRCRCNSRRGRKRFPTIVTPSPLDPTPCVPDRGCAADAVLIIYGRHRQGGCRGSRGHIEDWSGVEQCGGPLAHQLRTIESEECGRMSAEDILRGFNGG